MSNFFRNIKIIFFNNFHHLFLTKKNPTSKNGHFFRKKNIKFNFLYVFKNCYTFPKTNKKSNFKFF